MSNHHVPLQMLNTTESVLPHKCDLKTCVCLLQTRGQKENSALQNDPQWSFHLLFIIAFIIASSCCTLDIESSAGLNQHSG